MKYRTIIETEISDGTSIEGPDQIILEALEDYCYSTGICIEPKIISTEEVE
jgi:hypothetical protein